MISIFIIFHLDINHLSIHSVTHYWCGLPFIVCIHDVIWLCIPWALANCDVNLNCLVCRHRGNYLLLFNVFAGVPAKRNVVTYDCCPEEYIDLTFTVNIRRRKLYYVFNLVVPCLFLSFLSLLVFWMPPECGEKITMGRSLSHHVNRWHYAGAICLVHWPG